jgi:hypothetical protein
MYSISLWNYPCILVSSSEPRYQMLWRVSLYWWWKNLRLRTEFSSQVCNDIFSFFQKRFSESIEFALLVLKLDLIWFDAASEYGHGFYCWPCLSEINNWKSFVKIMHFMCLVLTLQRRPVFYLGFVFRVGKTKISGGQRPSGLPSGYITVYIFEWAPPTRPTQ